MKRLFILLCVPGLVWFGGVAAGTPGSGATRENVARTIVRDGGILDAAEGTDVVADSVVIAPGGTSGWHTHPAAELVLVKSGEITYYREDVEGCLAGTFKAGEAFVGTPAPQMAINNGSEPAELLVLFFGIPHEGQVRGDTERPPSCPSS